MHWSLLTEVVASPAAALLFVKGEIRFNHCGEASFVMPNAAVNERKNRVLGSTPREPPSVGKLLFYFLNLSEKLLLNP